MFSANTCNISLLAVPNNLFAHHLASLEALAYLQTLGPKEFSILLELISFFATIYIHLIVLSEY